MYGFKRNKGRVRSTYRKHDAAVWVLDQRVRQHTRATNMPPEVPRYVGFQRAVWSVTKQLKTCRVTG